MLEADLAPLLAPLIGFETGQRREDGLHLRFAEPIEWGRVVGGALQDFTLDLLKRPLLRNGTCHRNHGGGQAKEPAEQAFHEVTLFWNGG